ncbi:MAG: hypothetical protein JNK82_24700 [Myxococcaceae bacterium]|nr:hypothetical protein [Myxococcaceae bacterium]
MSFASAALAGDREVLGFSSDGRFVAYTESVFTTCTLYACDLIDDECTKSSEKRDDPKAACEAVKRSSAELLQSAKIGQGLGEKIEVKEAKGKKGESVWKVGDCEAAIASVDKPSRNLSDNLELFYDVTLTWRCGASRRVLKKWSNHSRVARLQGASRIGAWLVLFTSEAILGVRELPPGKKSAPEIIGFSGDASAFGWWVKSTLPDGQARAELKVVSTRDGAVLASETETGKGGEAEVLAALKVRVAPKLGKLGLGDDPGAELYTSGSAKKTTFKIDGAAYTLGIETKLDRAEITLAPSTCVTRKLAVLTGGSAWALSAARLAKDKQTLAVLVKYSREQNGREDRELGVGVTSIAPKPAVLTSLKVCLAAAQDDPTCQAPLEGRMTRFGRVAVTTTWDATDCAHDDALALRWFANGKPWLDEPINLGTGDGRDVKVSPSLDEMGSWELRITRGAEVLKSVKFVVEHN